MTRLINIYCDESCHLEHQKINPDNRYMVLGGVACFDSDKEAISKRIKSIKKKHNMSHLSEMKWTKVSHGKIEAYKEVINYFFDHSELSFRSIVVDKTQLNHCNHNQSHNGFYYKMYWQMLEWFIDPDYRFNIYLDIKDTQGIFKVEELKTVLCNSNHDFDCQIITKVQEVRSHEIALLQITDILIGAISYVQRYGDEGKSAAKKELISHIKERSNLSLKRSTVYGARKFNIFCWEGQKS